MYAGTYYFSFEVLRLVSQRQFKWEIIFSPSAQSSLVGTFLLRKTTNHLYCQILFQLGSKSTVFILRALRQGQCVVECTHYSSRMLFQGHEKWHNIYTDNSAMYISSNQRPGFSQMFVRKDVGVHNQKRFSYIKKRHIFHSTLQP